MREEVKKAVESMPGVIALSDRKLDVWRRLASEWTGSTPVNPKAFLALVEEVQRQRQALRDQEAEIGRHVKMLADCFRMAGADADGNEDWRIAPDALRAVTDLRRDYDEVRDWQVRAEKAEALLRSESALLRAWAKESRDGGWSAHQVGPMNRRADEIDHLTKDTP